MNKIDLQLIAQNLLSSNVKLQNSLKKDGDIVSIKAKTLTVKYQELSIFDKDDILIKFVHNKNGVYTLIPYAVNNDNTVKFFNLENKLIENFTVKDYYFSESLSYLTIFNDDFELVINAKISKTCIARIRKNDDKPLIGNGDPELILLEDKIIFTPIKELSLGDYQVIKNHGKKTKIHDDLLIDVRDLKTKKEYQYIAVNSELSKLVSKYNLECKFSVIGYEKFLNKEGKDAVKTLIKDLIFQDDLSDLDF